MKRIFDLSLSVILIFVLSPFILFIAILVRILDGSPILFIQQRVGRHGELFSILKFRTMRSDSHGLQVTSKGDPRVTKLGRFLRASKLDELPQLLNVLKGEMSFVGPRPEVPKYVSLYTLEQRKVLELTPGVTDQATIAFRDEETLLASAEDPEAFYIQHCVPKKIELNLAYASKADLFSDIGIIVKTVTHLFFRRRSQVNS